jgi:hypothetical protein
MGLTRRLSSGISMQAVTARYRQLAEFQHKIPLKPLSIVAFEYANFAEIS